MPASIAMLAEQRLDARPLLHELGLADGARADPLYLPLAYVRRFFDGCARLAGDPWFGWHLASAMPLGMYGLVEFVLRTSGTLRAGIETVCRYGSLINGLLAFELEERDDAVGFGFSIAGEREAAGTHLNEYSIHYMLKLVRLFGNGAILATSIDLAHQRPRTATLLETELGIPVRFGAKACRIWIPRGVLDRPSPLSDPGLHRFLEDQVMSALSIDRGDDIVRAVHDVLESRLGRSSLDVADVATALGTSPRTLQRRLYAAGTAYRDVVDLVRHERARELVLVESLSIAEIARRVGYDDPAVFARSFKRWTGRSPREHRRP